MKKVLIGCGIVAFLFMLGIAGCMALFYMAGGDSQKEFYDAMATGDEKNVTALFRPELMQEIDEPVLAVWVKAFNENPGVCLGPCLNCKLRTSHLAANDGPNRISAIRSSDQDRAE